jgi:hypothetical protein
MRGIKYEKKGSAKEISKELESTTLALGEKKEYAFSFLLSVV